MSVAEQQRTLYQVNKTVMEMLHLRGYAIPKTELEKTFDEFKAKHCPNQEDVPDREKLLSVWFTKDDSRTPIMIWFPKTVRIGVQEIQAVFLYLLY
jgi:hypothetical protein